MKEKFTKIIWFLLLFLVIQCLSAFRIAKRSFLQMFNPMITILFLLITLMLIYIIYLAIKRKKRFIPWVKGYMIFGIIGNAILLSLIGFVLSIIFLRYLLKSESIKIIFIK